MVIKEQNIYIPRLVKQMIFLFFPVLFALLSVSYYVYQNEAENEQYNLSESETRNLSLQQNAIRDTFNNIISDLIVLASHNAINHLFNNPDDHPSVHQHGLTREFIAFINSKKVFDQLRFLDQSGQEIIRIEYNNGKASFVPQAKLQNKSDRYYFKKSMALKAGQVYVSPFDLNIEQGKIEMPLKPVIRFGIPIVDQKGNKYGVIMLNYLGMNLLHAIENISSSTTGKIMLINFDGYWLKGLKQADEWGFHHQDKKGLVFSSKYPNAWGKIHSTESVQFIEPQGMFTSTTIHPLDSSREAKMLASGNYYWKLVSFIPSETLSRYAQSLKKTLVTLTFFLAIGWFFVCIIIAYEREKDYLNKLSIKEKDEIIRGIVDAAFDAIITIDEHGIISSFNPAAQQIFGYEESEIIGNSINLIIPSPHKEMHNDYLARYITTRETHVINEPREMEAQKKDGSIFPIEICVGAKETNGKWLFTGILRDITERKQLKAELEKMAITDALTGSYNRGHFDQVFDSEFSRSARYQLPLSLIIMDADNFKDINDNYGHLAGDAFLIALAKEIHGIVRELDIVARYGGEEFVVILPQTDGDDAMILAERIRTGIEKIEVLHDGHRINCTTSIGVATFKEGSTKSSDQLLSLADKALYMAKKAGRNRVCKA